MTNVENNTVYISYSGAAGSVYKKYADYEARPLDDKKVRDTIVKNLRDNLKDGNIPCKEFSLSNYTGNIKEFREQFAHAKYIVIVLSNKYLISPQCMVEWDMIHSQENKVEGRKIWYVYYDEEAIYGNDGLMKLDSHGKEFSIKKFAFFNKNDGTPDDDSEYYNTLIRPALEKWSEHPDNDDEDLAKIVKVTNLFEDSFRCMKQILHRNNQVVYRTSKIDDNFLYKLIDQCIKNGTPVRSDVAPNNFNHNNIEGDHNTAVAGDGNTTNVTNNYFGGMSGRFQNVSPYVKRVHTLEKDFYIDYAEFKYEDPCPKSLETNQDVISYGREDEAVELFNRFQLQPIVSVKAIGGMGKTFFAHKYKKMFRDVYYKHIHHIYLQTDIVNEFIDKMSHNFINNYDFSDSIDHYREKDIEKGLKKAKEIVPQKIDAIIDVLKNVSEKTLLILDINVTDGKQFKNSILLYKLLALGNDNWHILLLSRKSFGNKNIEMPLGGLKPQDAIDMFRGVSGIKDRKVCSDEALLNVFGMEGFNYHSLLISALASHCRRKIENGKDVDFGNLSKLLKKAKTQDLNDDVKKHNTTLDDDEVKVIDYLNLLIDFDSYGRDCEVLLRHFILWDSGSNVPEEVIKSLLKGYFAVDDDDDEDDDCDAIENALDALVNDMVITKSEEEYRIEGRTISVFKQLWTNYLNSYNPEESKIFSRMSEQEILEQFSDNVQTCVGYRMHGLLVDTLRAKAVEESRAKATEEKSDESDFYSAYLYSIKDLCINPKKIDFLANMLKNIEESLYGNNIYIPLCYNKSIGILYVMLLAHYYYLPDMECRKKRDEDGGEIDKAVGSAIESISDIDVESACCYKEADDLCIAIHDAARVLWSLSRYGSAVVFCEKALMIRRKIDASLSEFDSRDNSKKMSVECCMLGILYCLYKDELQQKNDANEKFNDAIQCLEDASDLPSKALKFQIFSVYHNLYDKSLDSEKETTLFEELDKCGNPKYSPVPKMIPIKGGHFDMGCEDKDAYLDESPIHRVGVEDFELGIFPVTQMQWDYVIGGVKNQRPSFLWCDYHRGLGCDYPIYSITWNEAQAFVKEINSKLSEGGNYSLPKEVQWEYAAKGGHKTTDEEKTKIKYSGTRDGNIGIVAWYYENSEATTHPVGKKEANELGLYDMSGNVLEWCQDVYDSGFYKKCKNNTNLQPDPCNEGDSGSARVLRGGSWDYDARYCRVSFRYYYRPGRRDNDIGFRLSLSPQKEEKKKK